MTPTQEEIKALCERLRGRAKECATASAHDDKDRYMNVVAKLTRSDGTFMAKAADALEALAAQAAELRAHRDEARKNARDNGMELCRQRSLREAAEKRLAEVEAERDTAIEADKASMEYIEAMRAKFDRLESAARAVIDQWDTPNWKLTEATAPLIEKLCSELSGSDVVKTAREGGE